MRIKFTYFQNTSKKVASLHLERLGVKMTKLTDEQSEYLGIAKNGPYKPDQYRY